MKVAYIGLFIMRFYFRSICKCFGLFPEDPKGVEETVNKEEMDLTVMNHIKEINSESLFRIKETRQRSVDYVIQSPRFGIPSVPDCTGGTDSNSVN
jgi:hypothetical protein